MNPDQRTYTIVGCSPRLRPGWFYTHKLEDGIPEADLSAAISEAFTLDSDLVAVGIWAEFAGQWFGGVRRV